MIIDLYATAIQTIFRQKRVIIEKQSHIQVSYYWLNVLPAYQDWFRSLDYENG